MEGDLDKCITDLAFISEELKKQGSNSAALFNAPHSYNSG